MDIRGLAQHLGLSIGTVSRALNGQAEVSPVTRARVIEAARIHGYTPNQAGRSLRSRRTGVVAFALPITAEGVAHGDPFFLGLLDGVQRTLEAAGLELIVLPVRSDHDAEALIKRHLGRGLADAWILAATQQEDRRIAALVERAVPFVTLGRSDTDGDFLAIDFDFGGMVDTAVARLAAAGHVRIALITSGPQVNFSHIVVEHYRRALQAAGLPVEPNLLYAGPVDVLSCEIAVTGFLAKDSPPSAIIVLSENGPVGVYAALRTAGLEPGSDVAVIGLRRTPSCAALAPSLTCFALDPSEVGASLASALIATLRPGDLAAPRRTLCLWPLALIEADSDRVQPTARLSSHG